MILRGHLEIDTWIYDTIDNNLEIERHSSGTGKMCAIKCLLPSPDRITKLQVHKTLFACVQTFSIDHSHVSFKSASTFIKTQWKVLSKKCNKNLHRTNCTPSVQMKLTWRKSCLNA